MNVMMALPVVPSGKLSSSNTIHCNAIDFVYRSVWLAR